MLRDVAKLARAAENWGADGQGKLLAEFAEAVGRQDMKTAMEVRDKIHFNRNDARVNRLLLLSTFGFCAAPFVLYWLS